MRKPLIAAGVLAATLASGAAYAQQPPTSPGDAGNGAQQGMPPGGPGGAPGFIIVEGPPQGGPGGGSGGPGQPAPMPPGANPLIMGGPAAGRAMQEQMMRGGPPHPMPRPMMAGGPGGPGHERGGEDEMEMMRGGMMHGHVPRGAVFMFRRGDQRVLIKCADDEPTKACVDGATTLLDKLAGAAQGGGQGGATQGGATQGGATQGGPTQ